MTDSSTQVYVFRVGQLGDTVVALPAVYEIAKRHRDVRFTLITNAPARSTYVTAWEVLRHTGLFGDVLFYDPSSTWSALRLAMTIRARAGRRALYYLAPHRVRRQLLRDRAFYQIACGFRTIAGLEDAGTPELRNLDGSLRPLPRECDRLLDVVCRYLGTDGSTPSPPLLRPPAAAERRAAALLSRHDGALWVAIGAGSKMAAKKWFGARFVALGRRLLERYPRISLAIVGGPEERGEGDSLAEELGSDRVVNLAGLTDIIESAEVLRRCALYVGNDTGTMHLAAVMGTRCVSVFTSRANPGIWEPWGTGHVSLRRELPCSGCMLTDCIVEKMRCLDLITVDDVWVEVERALDDVGATSGAT